MLHKCGHPDIYYNKLYIFISIHWHVLSVREQVCAAMVKPYGGAEVLLIEKGMNLVSFIDEISEAYLKKAVKRLKPHSTGGPVGIPAFITKDCISVFTTPLLHLYNLPLRHSTFPERWQCFRVTPIPKLRTDCSIKNFKPIPVFSVYGKIFKWILNFHITRQARNTFDNRQHGFRVNRGRSKNTNLESLWLIIYALKWLWEGWISWLMILYYKNWRVQPSRPYFCSSLRATWMGDTRLLQ